MSVGSVTGAAAKAGSAVVIAVLATVSAATAQSGTVSSSKCSEAFHQALGTLAQSRGDALGKAVDAAKAADTALAGQWLYSQTLFPSKKSKVPPTKVCIEERTITGRVRCVKYGEATPSDQPRELTITPAPNAEELRIIKALHDVVEAKGGVPDVGPNGRYSWLSQRAAGDLKTYMTQPAHPAMCSGGKEFAEYYAQILRPMQKRLDDVSELAKKARALAIARVGEAVPTEAAKPQTSTDMALPALVADSVRGALQDIAVATLAKESTVWGALKAAKPLLADAQAAAQAGDDQKQRDQILASARALRMLEAAAYADLYVARYKQFAADVLTMPKEIQRVHSGACTCSN